MSGGWSVYWIGFGIFAMLTMKVYSMPATPLRGKAICCDKCRSEYAKRLHAQDAMNITGYLPLVALITGLIWPASVMAAFMTLPHYISGHKF